MKLIHVHNNVYIKLEKANDSIKEKVVNFLKKNPHPNDEKEFHKFAETLSKEHSVGEETAYEILGNFLSGGASKGKTNKVNQKELNMGIEVELEHTKDKIIAEKIARDHLAEFPNYYTALAKMEDMLSLQKARPTKYISKKKVKGKWEYTSDTKESKSGGVIDAILSFFGVKDKKQAQEKAKEIYTENKSSLGGIDFKTFTNYLGEYLANKDKWDKKLSGKKDKGKIVKDKKTGELKRKPSGDKSSVMSGDPQKLDKKDFPDSISTQINNPKYSPLSDPPKGYTNDRTIERVTDNKSMKSGFEMFGEKFVVAKNQYGSWVVYEIKSGKGTGTGKTIKEATDNSVKAIKNAGEKKLKELINQSNNLSTADKKSEEINKKRIEESNKKDKSYFDSDTFKNRTLADLKDIDLDMVSEYGKKAIKNLIKEKTSKPKEVKKETPKTDQGKYDAAKNENSKIKNDLEYELGYPMNDDGSFDGYGEKLSFQDAIEEYHSISGVDVLKNGWKSKVDKDSHPDIEKSVKMYKDFIKNNKILKDTKEKLLGPKLFKALSPQWQDIAIQELKKAKEMPVGTISNGRKKMPDGSWVPVSEGKTDKKDEEKPEDKKDDNKKDEKSKTEAVKEKIKSSLKEAISILADAFSGKDTVQPTGSTIESEGETLKQQYDPKKKEAERKKKAEAEKKKKEELAKKKKEDKNV